MSSLIWGDNLKGPGGSIRVCERDRITLDLVVLCDSESFNPTLRLLILS